MEDEIHIAGVLVHALPAQVCTVADTLAGWPDVEVSAVTPEGKVVVVCECAGGRALLALLERIRGLLGVVDAALVYQHAEPTAAMDEEMRDDRDPT